MTSKGSTKPNELAGTMEAKGRESPRFYVVVTIPLNPENMVERWPAGCVSRRLMEDLDVKDPDDSGIPEGMSFPVREYHDIRACEG
jgi:hypothetical protein